MVKQIVRLSLFFMIGLLIFTTCEDKVDKDTTPGIYFLQTFGGSIDEVGHSVQQTIDGGYIITGYTVSFGSGSEDVWIIKTDSQGNEEWNQTFGGSSSDVGYSVQQTSDGGYIIVGYTQSSGNGESDVWLIKTDLDGNEEWNQTFGGTGWDVGFSIQLTNDGGYIIAGGTSSYGNGDNDFWLLKVSSDGKEEWNQTFGGTGWDVGYSVQQTINRGYIIAGRTNYDCWMIKTDFLGDEEWSKTFGGWEINEGRSVQQTTDGGYIVTGWTISFEFNNMDIWLLKTDSQGNKEWYRNFGKSNNDVGYSVQQTIDDGYIITGETQSFGNGKSDVWLIKTNSKGKIEP